MIICVISRISRAPRHCSCSNKCYRNILRTRVVNCTDGWCHTSLLIARSSETAGSEVVHKVVLTRKAGRAAALFPEVRNKAVRLANSLLRWMAESHYAQTSIGLLLLWFKLDGWQRSSLSPSAAAATSHPQYAPLPALGAPVHSDLGCAGAGHFRLRASV